ncbi:MAG: hypothetical protein ACRD96_17080 [Bryobacteraceae bacterium]
MVAWETGKVEFTEAEASAALGISVDELRSLVRQHVIRDESEPELPVVLFRATDLIMFKMLLGRGAAA